MGSREFATRSVIRSRRNGEELRPEKTARPKNLEEIAHEICVTAGICVEDLRGSGRSRPISRARMMLVRRALVEDGLRAVDVARYLRMSTAAVAAYRRKFTS